MIICSKQDSITGLLSESPVFNPVNHQKQFLSLYPKFKWWSLSKMNYDVPGTTEIWLYQIRCTTTPIPMLLLWYFGDTAVILVCLPLSDPAQINL